MNDSKSYMVVVVRDGTGSGIGLISRGYGMQWVFQANAAIDITVNDDVVTMTRTAQQWSFAIAVEI